MKTIATLLITLLVPTAFAFAQEAPPSSAAAAPVNPLSDHNRLIYKGLKLVILGAAEKMPEESYGFKPVDTVRTFGQIVGHIADW